MPFPALARRLLLASTLALAPSAPLHGLAGAGGGGGSMPSASTPQFDVAAEYRRGIDALGAQRFAEAKKAFGRVLGAAPRDANANLLAGMADAGLNDLKAARKHYERAVKSDPNLVAARQELGATSAKMGDTARAQAELDQLNAMAAQCANACPDAAKLKRAVETVTAAMAAGPQARLETRPDPGFAEAGRGDRAYLDAVGLINEHRYADAIVSLRAADAAFGQHPDILTYLGFAQRKLGRYDLAESYYREALRIAPKHKGATEYYGELMIERGDRAGAAKMLARLDHICAFGCPEADELRRWIETGPFPAS